MILIYVLIGLAIVYAAFAFGRRKQSNYINLCCPEAHILRQLQMMRMSMTILKRHTSSIKAMAAAAN